MASVSLKVDFSKVNMAIGGVRASLRSKKSLLDSIGKALMEYTQTTITTQGRGTWAPLAKSTKLTTGRQKALITLRPYIRFRTNQSAGTATVYFSKRPSGWTLEQHEKGFTSRPVNGVLMKARNIGFFNKRKASVVPPRKVFPSTGEASTISGPIVRAWVDKQIRLYWHD